MKTLSEAVQMQIVEQAGTTYRSVVMAQIKDDFTKSGCVAEAFKITQFFIDMMVKNMTSGDVGIETPPILDFLNIAGVKNGN